MNNTLKFFVPLAVVITLAYGLIYASVQQVYRQSANDPQIQIAEDLSVALSNGTPPESIARANATDLNQSLATFVIIYDSSKAAVLSSASLDGKAPQVPSGVFDSIGFHSGSKNQSRFTWEPKDGIRVAAVLEKYSGKAPGYVLVGRSIREVEKREEMLRNGIVVAWVVTLLAAFTSIVFGDKVLARQSSRSKKK